MYSAYAEFSALLSVSGDALDKTIPPRELYKTKDLCDKHPHIASLILNAIGVKEANGGVSWHLFLKLKQMII